MGANDFSHPLQLEAAFADFEEASAKLAAFYENLEGQVSNLNDELRSARAAEVQQLREKEILAARLEALLEALPAGVVVLDGRGRIAEFNPAAVSLLGTLQSGDPWMDVVTRVFQPQWDDGHDISLKDGRRVNIATEPLHGEPGQILLIKDVSETRRLQELLNHHRRLSAKTELAAALAHQIRTPLSAAMLHTSNLSSRLADENIAGPIAARALDSMRQLERLVEDMLTYARGGKPDADEFVLTDLLDRLYTSAKINPPGTTFVVIVESPIPSITLVGNSDALLSMMMNLVNNARAASGSNGRITVAAEIKGDTAEITFTDNGPGIAEHEFEAVFEPFYSKANGGTGLGLAVARSIARSHGGDLVIDANYKDGARFVLSLPLPNELEAFGNEIQFAPNLKRQTR